MTVHVLCCAVIDEREVCVAMYAEPKGRSTVLPGGRTDKTSIVQCMTVHVLCCAVLRCAVIDERQVCVAMYAEAKGPGYCAARWSYRQD